MDILYDSKQQLHKDPFGCLAEQQPCRIRVDIPAEMGVTATYLLLENEQGQVVAEVLLPNIDVADAYEHHFGTFSLSQAGLYYYYFKLVTPQGESLLFKHDANRTAISAGQKWQLTCYQRDFSTPVAFQGRVCYQIFPDRFYHEEICQTDGKLTPFVLHDRLDETPIFSPDAQGIVQNNDFFGGNLRGILKKLSYLEELGVRLIYLNPVFQAYSNHRYDTCDYKRIDPLLGTQEDFSRLCEAAHQRGMKIILDVAFSHTGDRSIYFDRLGEFGGGAYHDQQSPYRDWYQMDPNNKDAYTAWWGIATLPCTNELAPSFLQYMIWDDNSVVAHWLRLGADGFRLDVADELPDAFIKQLRTRVKQLNPDAIIIGEVWEDASNKISYDHRREYLLGAELDTTMNYPFKHAIIHFVKDAMGSEPFANAIMEIVENYPKQVLDCTLNSLSTHDTIRILTELGMEYYPQQKEERACYRLSPHAYQQALEKMKLAVFLQFTLPGSACIYYGDEVGVQGFEDPFNRTYFPWQDDRYADGSYRSEALVAFHRRLARLKNEHPALRWGSLSVSSMSPGVVVFHRDAKEESLALIACMADHYDCFVDRQQLLLWEGDLHHTHLTLKQYGFALIQLGFDQP